MSTASRHRLETPHDREQVRGEDMRTQKEIEIEREGENVSDRQAPLPGPKPGLDTIQKFAKKRAMAPHPLTLFIHQTAFKQIQRLHCFELLNRYQTAHFSLKKI